MKKAIAIIVFGLLWCNVALASEFCDGFKKGYKTGYKVAHNTNFDPFPPYCPYQPYKRVGDPQSDYEHGYILGYKKGFGS